MKELSIEQTPPLPSVMIEIMRFDPGNPNSDSQAMENIIQPDKGVCAEILKVSNSALYGRSGKIKKLRDAITLMGVKTVKNLVILLSTKNLGGKLKGDLYKTHLKEFPILSALIALDLAKPLGLMQLKEDGFLGGLLHKIGMAIIALNSPDEYSAMLKTWQSGAESIIKMEREKFQTDHIKVGKTVFQAWKLPEQLQSIITEHNFKPEKLEAQDDLVRLTALASILSKKLLNLPLLDDEREKEVKIPDFYKTERAKIEKFNDEYYRLIKEHPFYEQAVS